MDTLRIDTQGRSAVGRLTCKYCWVCCSMQPPPHLHLMGASGLRRTQDSVGVRIHQDMSAVRPGYWELKLRCTCMTYEDARRDKVKCKPETSITSIHGGGRPLGSGRQLRPQLTVGRRPLGGGGGFREGEWGGGYRRGWGGGLREGRLGAIRGGGGGGGGSRWGNLGCWGGRGVIGSPYLPLPSL